MLSHPKFYHKNALFTIDSFKILEPVEFFIDKLLFFLIINEFVLFKRSIARHF